MAILSRGAWPRASAVVVVVVLTAGCGTSSIEQRPEVSPVFTVEPTESPEPTESAQPTVSPEPSEDAEVTVPPDLSPL